MITLFTKPDCVQCAATKRALDEKGVMYRTVDLTADRKAMSRVADFGYRQAPVVEVGPDHHWSGFRPDLIAKLEVEAT